MISRLHHQFKLAAPILGPLSILVFVVSFWNILATKQVGDGVDELTATLAGPMHVLDGFATQGALWFAGIALIATAVLAWQITRRISHPHGRKYTASPLERIAFWSGVIVVPMAYLVAPAIGGLSLIIIFGISALIHMTRR